MPIAITNAQSRISGEILSSTISDTTATMILTDQYQIISQSDMGFTSDRKGDILLTFEVYADKTNTLPTSIQMQLVSNGTAVTGTARTIADFGSTSGLYQVIVKKGNRDAAVTLRIGGSYPPMIFQAVGL
jgi:hypothetical protein